MLRMSSPSDFEDRSLGEGTMPTGSRRGRKGRRAGPSPRPCQSESPCRDTFAGRFFFNFFSRTRSAGCERSRASCGEGRNQTGRRARRFTAGTTGRFDCLKAVDEGFSRVQECLPSWISSGRDLAPAATTRSRCDFFLDLLPVLDARHTRTLGTARPPRIEPSIAS